MNCISLTAEPVPVASRGAGCAAELFLRHRAAQEAAAGSTLSPGHEHGSAALPPLSCPPAFPPAGKAVIFLLLFFFLRMNGVCFCECSLRDVKLQMFAH